MNTDPRQDAVRDVEPVEKTDKNAGAPLFTALVAVPCATVTAILLLAFSLATLAGAVSALGGLVYAVASPFFAARSGVTNVFIQIGAGLIVSGLGLVVFSAFLLLTRSYASFSLRLLRYVKGR